MGGFKWPLSVSVKQKPGPPTWPSPTWDNLTFLWKWCLQPQIYAMRGRDARDAGLTREACSREPELRDDNTFLQLPAEAPVLSELSMKGLSPIVLLGTFIFFILKEGFPNLHASRISAFPFLKNPIIPWRSWTLPSSVAGWRVQCAARAKEGTPQLSRYVTHGPWIYSHQNCWCSFQATNSAHQAPHKRLEI